MDRSSLDEARKALALARSSSLRDILSDAAFFANVQLYKHLHQRTGRNRTGTNVFERNWDVLVILDACRLDLMRNVAHEYDFIDDVSSFRSLGSHSREWMEHTFTPAYTHYMQNTAYISGNPFTDNTLSDDMFSALDEVWKYAWDDDLGTIPARPITDSAIQHWRQSDPDRMIVHYMQPHAPFIDAPELGKGMATDEWGGLNRGEVWRNLRLGRASYPAVLEAYEQNLRHVLDDVALLRENITADTVAVTADHGNALGEQFMYGHPYGVAIDVLRDVPWATFTATNNETHQPDILNKEERGDIEDKLEDLGYM